MATRRARSGGQQTTGANAPPNITPPQAASHPSVQVDEGAHGPWMYARGHELLRASRAELDAIDERHRALGYGAEPSAEALAGAISACAPHAVTEPLVRCTCGAEMPARLLAECAARAANPSVWSLHRERMRGVGP